jgi:hypothetical protein
MGVSTSWSPKVPSTYWWTSPVLFQFGILDLCLDVLQNCRLYWYRYVVMVCGPVSKFGRSIFITVRVVRLYLKLYGYRDCPKCQPKWAFRLCSITDGAVDGLDLIGVSRCTGNVNIHKRPGLLQSGSDSATNWLRVLPWCAAERQHQTFALCRLPERTLWNR